jgi:hypothetical protein
MEDIYIVHAPLNTTHLVFKNDLSYHICAHAYRREAKILSSPTVTITII